MYVSMYLNSLIVLQQIKLDILFDNKYKICIKNNMNLQDYALLYYALCICFVIQDYALLK